MFLVVAISNWGTDKAEALWSSPENISNLDGSDDDPCLAVGGDDTLHVVWHGGLSGETFQVYYSNYADGEWTEPVDLSGAAWWCLMPFVVVDGCDILHVAWAGYSGPEGDAEIYYTRRDCGLWSEPENVSNSPWINNRYPAMAVDGEDAVHLVYEHQELPGYIMYRRLAGGEWTPPMDIARESGWHAYCPVIVVDYCGRAHAAWEVTQFDEVFYTRQASDDWTCPQNVSNEPGYSYNPKLERDRSNRIHFIWEGGMTPYGEREVLYRSREQGNWSFPERLNPQVWGTEPDLATDAGDTLHAVWNAQIGYDPFFLYSRCTADEWTPPDTVLQEGNVSCPDLEIDSDNTLHCVYARGQEIFHTCKTGPGSTWMPVSLDIMPESIPVVIPPEGGRFDCTVTLRNRTGEELSVVAWLGASLPTGEEYGPVAGPLSVSMRPYQVIVRHVAQVVPGIAPGGTYCYHGYVAGQYPASVLDHCHIRMIKTED